jgi:hypothetical protein
MLALPILAIVVLDGGQIEGVIFLCLCAPRLLTAVDALW